METGLKNIYLLESRNCFTSNSMVQNIRLYLFWSLKNCWRCFEILRAWKIVTPPFLWVLQLFTAFTFMLHLDKTNWLWYVGWVEADMWRNAYTYTLLFLNKNDCWRCEWKEFMTPTVHLFSYWRFAYLIHVGSTSIIGCIKTFKEAINILTF